jgi:O-antigen/teichoic acid export membrane protein
MIGALAALGYGALTARWLGPHDKGLVSLVALLAHLVSLFGALGVHEALAYVRNRRGFTAAEVHAGIVLLVGAWGLPLALGTAWAVHAFGALLWRVEVPLWLALMTGALVWLRLSLLLGRHHLVAEGRFGVANTLDVLFVVVPFALVLPLGLAHRADAMSVLGVTLVATWAIAIAQSILRRGYRGPAPWGRMRAMLGATMRYSLQTCARVVGANLLYRVNVFLVGAMLDLRSVGWYAAALMGAEVLLRVPDAITWWLAPRASCAEEGAVNGLTARALRGTLAVTVVLSALLALALPWGVPALLGEAYRPAILPALLLLPGVLCAVVYQVLSAGLTGRGMAGGSLAATWLGVGAMVGLNLLAIPRWGMAGAAGAASLAHLIAATALTITYCRATGSPLAELFLPQPVDRALVRQVVRRAAGIAAAITTSLRLGIR